MRSAVPAPRRPLRALAALLTLSAALLVGSAWLAPLPPRLHVADSGVLAWEDGSAAHVILAADDRWRLPTRARHVDPAYQAALLRLEDKRFWWHPGVDPLAVVRALTTNLARRRRVSGASTLTLQLVRMLEPRPRTLRAKLIEAHRALTLELRLSKAEILEAYLRFVPYGGNIEGVEAASWALFGHDATALSPDEIATLLAIPQAPARRSPRSGTPGALRGARARIAASLGLDPDAVRDAPVPAALRPLPRELPHLAHTLRLRPGQRRHSTAHQGTQRRVQRMMDALQPSRAQQGIHNTTALVVDRRTAEVRAVVGNFADPSGAHGGDIAAYQVPRSPGSALKPFLYGMAIDRAVALPESLVLDIPRRYADYRPENFDGGYDGMVRLEEALSRSLNLPFIELLGQIGVDTWTGALRRSGARSLIDAPGHYGVSAAVGGLELSPIELAMLYTALASDGQPQALRWEANTPTAPGARLLSPEAAWLTRRALRLRDRPDLPVRRDLTQIAPDVAWKTGTSFSHRDAWAVGIDAQHLVVVWMGNLDRRPSPHLVGASAAGEVLFDLLGALRDQQVAWSDPQPPGLIPVEVCALSGAAPGVACHDRTHALARADRVPPTPCSLHAHREVRRSDGLAVTPWCHDGSPTERVVVTLWPSVVQGWLGTRARAGQPPPWAPGCAQDAGDGPRILQPVHGEVVLLNPQMPMEAQAVRLEAQATGPVAWFVNERWIGTYDDGVAWWSPHPGRHTAVAQDAAGRMHRRQFTARFPSTSTAP